MKTFTKILAMVLALSLTAALSIGLTTAYLTDTDEDVNVMTLGNVDIEQHEYERELNADGTYKTDTIDGVTSYVLKNFTQAKPLLPSAVVVSSTPWDSTVVRMTQVDSYGGMQTFLPVTNAQDKFVTVENTGKTDAYIRTLVAIEVGSAEPSLISFSNHLTWEDNGIGTITIDGNNYYLHEFTYTGGKHLGGQHEKGILPAGETSYPSLSQVYIKPEATNEDMVKLDGNGNGTLDILVVSQAVQVAGFADAETALNAGFGDITTTNHPWADTAPVIPTVVSTADELTAAIANGGSIVLADDVELAQNETITIGNGTEVALNLNGHTLSAENTRTATHNFMIDVKGGTLSIENGTVSMEHTGSNMAWNGATTVIDVTAGGVLNLEGVTVKNEGGTDMNFSVHLNNWGEVTLNANNCVFDATYCGVRVFNSGYDMNNVKITNSTLKGKTRAFWVHNYIGDLNSAQHSDDAIKARLNLDIFGNNNTFTTTDTVTSPIRYGFGTTVYIDTNGNVIP